MEIDICSKLSVIPLELTQPARDNILARLKLLWQAVKPVDRPNLVQAREADIASLAASLQIHLVNGKPEVVVPPSLAIAWNFLLRGSFSHKAIPNLPEEIVAASQL